MDRPTALDLAFLDLETPQAPLHVGWTLRFGGRAPSIAALRRHLDARLGAVPRFRRRLAHGTWVDDVRFDVAHHAFGVTAPAPGGAEQLREVAGVLLSRPLPLNRPLWRMYLVDGLDGGFAIVGQAHHALVDGVAAIEVAQLLFGPEAAYGRDGRAWAPEAAPAAGAALWATAETRARAAAGAVRDAAGALWGTEPGVPRPDSAARATEVLRTAARAVDALTHRQPPTSLERSATARRLVAYAGVPLDAVRAAGARREATVNDVLLAATSIALRAALRRRGDARETVRALVPVNVRGEAGGEAVGNRISFLAVELPVGEPAPDRVLTLVHARTVAGKAGGDAGALEALGRAADALPGPGRRAVARAALRAVPFTLVVSNVPGPPATLALLGRPLRAIHPMVPLLHGHALTVGAVSYDGRLHVGLAADAEVVPDVVDLARDLEAAFDALRLAPPEAVVDVAEPPWRARARARRGQRAANR
ncbi:putative diacylglycerol O-acyltransferase tgs1 [Baekduia alba]|uniref:wax ester/triacylglycerol synthase family O-acyltransferase n=1 Tax=Baekduia alba TaxID=2997333 RepID=UPI002342630C|nr:wax ester/triacylglycerol synthase family O-acyltransferase [Baekduia alba]WCB96054.1 putative diacylglycerol O-acyltransferase tgs1 [Baekduia alba]